MPNYVVNKTTRTLHIEGLCSHLKRCKSTDTCITFSSEEAAQKYFSGNLKQCKTCWSKRDSH